MARQITWGLIGGGEGSQIGFPHRAGAALDGRFALAASALDADPERGKDFGVRLGIAPDRSYGDWREMLAGEAKRDDRVRLVTVATPNSTHFEISKALLEAGIDVFCEKPMTMTVEEGRELVAIAGRLGRVCAVNFGYSGYPMVRHMRAMVERGDLGQIRVVKAEFAGGFYGDAAHADDPRVGWRFDPALAGVSAVTADIGSHAMHLACYVTGQRVSALSADFARGIPSRQLEDDALLAFRMSGGTVGRAWCSGLAFGRTHGLEISVYGEKGGLRWCQEQPNQLSWTPLNQPTQTLERSASYMSPAAQRASRITIGHPEGFVFAMSNLYRDLADIIEAKTQGREPDPLALTVPSADLGLHIVDVVHAAARSASDQGRWIEL
jgi:predicted dehydrogenase